MDELIWVVMGLWDFGKFEKLKKACLGASEQHWIEKKCEGGRKRIVCHP